MSPVLLGFVWLAASLVVAGFAALRLQPKREAASNSAVDTLRMTRLDALMAACIALFLAAVAYLIFGVFVPTIIGWRPGLVVELLIVLPFLAFGLMHVVARVLPGRSPSWRALRGSLWRTGHFLMLLVLLPVVLTHIAAPIWIYPALLYASCFAMMLKAYRQASNGASPTAEASP